MSHRQSTWKATQAAFVLLFAAHRWWQFGDSQPHVQVLGKAGAAGESYVEKKILDIKDFLFHFGCSFWSVCCQNNWPSLHQYYISVSFCTEIRASLPLTLSGTQIGEHCEADDLGRTSEDTPRVLMSYI